MRAVLTLNLNKVISSDHETLMGGSDACIWKPSASMLCIICMLFICYSIIWLLGVVRLLQAWGQNFGKRNIDSKSFSMMHVSRLADGPMTDWRKHNLRFTKSHCTDQLWDSFELLFCMCTAIIQNASFLAEDVAQWQADVPLMDTPCSPSQEKTATASGVAVAGSWALLELLKPSTSMRRPAPLIWLAWRTGSSFCTESFLIALRPCCAVQKHFMLMGQVVQECQAQQFGTIHR